MAEEEKILRSFYQELGRVKTKAKEEYDQVKIDQTEVEKLEESFKQEELDVDDLDFSRRKMEKPENLELGWENLSTLTMDLVAQKEGFISPYSQPPGKRGGRLFSPKSRNLTKLKPICFEGDQIKGGDSR
jgi:hypothetical protein